MSETGQIKPSRNLWRFQTSISCNISEIRRLDLMSHPNERVELAMQILELRRKLRQAASDDDTIKEIQAELKLVERKLQEIDE